MSQICVGPCCRHELQSQRAVNFIDERAAVNASHIDFRHFLQAQLTSWRPYTVHYHQPQQYETRFNTTKQYAMAEQQSYTPICGPQPSPMHPPPEHHVSTLSFFRDSFDYSAEEATCFHPSQHKLEHNDAFRPLSTLTQPFHPASMAPTTATVAPAALVLREGSVMPRLDTNVDPAQYQLVQIDDWRRASLPFDTSDEEDTSSPASTQATSLGPYTPASSDGDLTFAEAAMRRHSLDFSVGSFGSDMFSNSSFELQPHSSEAAGTDHVTAAPQPHVGFQYGDLYTPRYAGLPLTDSDLSTLTPATADEKNNPLTISQASFRDVNGLPTVLPIRFKKRNSTSSTRTAASSAGSMSSSSTEAGSDLTLVHTEQDQYLLDMRRKGYTYRHIKRVGRFTEAESTLRGRVRVLTKDKSKRVRKPEWSGNDVGLLPFINRIHH